MHYATYLLIKVVESNTDSAMNNLFERYSQTTGVSNNYLQLFLYFPETCIQNWSIRYLLNCVNPTFTTVTVVLRKSISLENTTN